MLSKKCPCKDCEKRYPNCHSLCEGYIEWRKALDEENERIREEKFKRSLVFRPTGNKYNKFER